MRRTVLSLGALLALALLVAPATGAERFQRHLVRGEGVSLAAPASWIAVDGRVPAAALLRLTRDDPRLAPFLQQLAQPRSPMRFIALDRVVRGGFATNVNVVVAPVPAGLSFAAYRSGLLAELRTIGARGVTQRAVRIRGARAVRVGYRFDITVQTKRTVQTLQYAFLRPGRSVVVTYTTLPAFATRYAATFRRSAASIRFAS